MKIFIPEIGTRLQLTKNWTFMLYAETRNYHLIVPEEDDKNRREEEKEADAEFKRLQNLIREEMHGRTAYSYNDSKYYKEWYAAREKCWSLGRYKVACKYKDKEYTFPKGTVLEVDRIYIRQGNQKYSSITFKIRGKKVLRFWAKLADVNNIECKVLEDKEEREQFSAGGGANYFHG